MSATIIASNSSAVGDEWSKKQISFIFMDSNQIGMRQFAHMQKYPEAKLISLGIGDTTQPIPDVVTSAMAEVTSGCFWIHLKTQLNINFAADVDVFAW